MSDLWPENLTNIETTAPVAILREQASLLGAKTKNLVKARVGDVQIVDGITRKYGPFSFSFELVAPALGRYRYRLFDATHDVSLYPVRIFTDEDVAKELGVDPETPLVVATEQELLEAMGRIFSSTKTRQVIHAIVAQSTTGAK